MPTEPVHQSWAAAHSMVVHVLALLGGQERPVPSEAPAPPGRS